MHFNLGNISLAMKKGSGICRCSCTNGCKLFIKHKDQAIWYLSRYCEESKYNLSFLPESIKEPVKTSNPILLKCNDCGNVFEYTLFDMMSGRKAICCYNCHPELKKIWDRAGKIEIIKRYLHLNGRTFKCDFASLPDNFKNNYKINLICEKDGYEMSMPYGWIHQTVQGNRDIGKCLICHPEISHYMSREDHLERIKEFCTFGNRNFIYDPNSLPQVIRGDTPLVFICADCGDTITINPNKIQQTLKGGYYQRGWCDTCGWSIHASDYKAMFQQFAQYGNRNFEWQEQKTPFPIRTKTKVPFRCIDCGNIVYFTPDMIGRVLRGTEKYRGVCLTCNPLTGRLNYTTLSRDEGLRNSPELLYYRQFTDLNGDFLYKIGIKGLVTSRHAPNTFTSIFEILTTKGKAFAFERFCKVYYNLGVDMNLHPVMYQNKPEINKYVGYTEMSTEDFLRDFTEEDIKKILVEIELAMSIDQIFEICAKILSNVS